MKKLKKLLVMLMVMTLALGLIGCGKKDANNGSETGNNTTLTYPIEVQDTDGNTITIESEPQKVVSVAPNLTELMYKLGLGEKLVGRSDYCDYPEEVKSLPTVGSLYTPNIESIIALEPDLVLISTHFTEENQKQLEDLGIKVLSLYDANNIEGAYTMIETIAKAFNVVGVGNEVVQSMKDTFADIAAKTKDLDHKSVYYVVGYGEGGDFTATGDTFINTLIELAGGDNIAKDGTDWSYSKESLLEADPDVIIVRQGEAEAFKTADQYKELTACKEGRVYEMNTNLFDRQGYRNAEGVKELATILYPDVVK